eukprot:GILJ01006222.1.p2 GENE.GILJ01006222.1~~GILJ01006222.1.p2  ORF type:complete len:150 (-),score=1.27 GILJ01006222.1:161-610(-)
MALELLWRWLGDAAVRIEGMFASTVASLATGPAIARKGIGVINVIDAANVGTRRGIVVPVVAAAPRDGHAIAADPAADPATDVGIAAGAAAQSDRLGEFEVPTEAPPLSLAMKSATVLASAEARHLHRRWNLEFPVPNPRLSLLCCQCG